MEYEYAVIEFKFSTGVHFGNGLLNNSSEIFHADSLFSALYIESMKAGIEDKFFDLVKSGKLLFSNAFPYKDGVYYLPKPILYIKRDDENISSERKKFKKIKYIPVDLFDIYLKGKYFTDGVELDFGEFESVTKVSISADETLPYQVGIFKFSENCGLYIIIRYENEDVKYMLEDLLISLGLTGIGGKKTSGLGKFDFKYGRDIQDLTKLLERSGAYYMSLSDALPMKDELDEVMINASYLLEKRSGFVASEKYADEYRKKRDLFVFSAGSCFKQKFKGDIYDVSDGGSHPVYRYAKTLFVGV